MYKRNLWRFQKETLQLILDPISEEDMSQYEINLERCPTSAEVLDWIMQVAGKTWASDRILAGLIHELNRILGPQLTLCPDGKERGPIDIKKLLKEKKLID